MPDRVLQAQLRRDIWYVLVQWQGMPASKATWEKLQEFQDSNPDVQLEDELFAKAGRDVRTGLHYGRREPN
ncbi:hypothetical protein GUJ93_ZPchr0006g42461 [Zizania palustris]|uniref:Chromo domain-containing protein n=1 Tax=Zizania palustris TaxID=103762 RepID=A0A8J5SNH3_ZIZPA|nr:hypothetical protein GUJ93_ZPchr0006g42461 [Zizania palustris]